jgi:hypothetical protein
MKETLFLRHPVGSPKPDSFVSIGLPSEDSSWNKAACHCTKAFMFDILAVIRPVPSNTSCQMRLGTIWKGDGVLETYSFRALKHKIEKTTL